MKSKLSSVWSPLMYRTVESKSAMSRKDTTRNLGDFEREDKLGAKRR